MAKQKYNKKNVIIGVIGGAITAALEVKPKVVFKTLETLIKE